jgi:hypothetical protein
MHLTKYTTEIFPALPFTASLEQLLQKREDIICARQVTGNLMYLLPGWSYFDLAWQTYMLTVSVIFSEGE